MIARLFTYGTLQPGRLRWPFLAPYVAGHRPAQVRGRIFDSGLGWPVMVFDETTGPVPGTIVDLDRHRLEEILLLLDDVERVATDLLTRIVVTTTVGDVAWAYHCTASTAGMTPIDRWVASVER